MGSADFESTDELSEAGQQVEPEAAIVPAGKAKPFGLRRFGLGWRLRAGLAAASLIIVLSAALWWGYFGHETGGDYDPYTIKFRPIRGAVESVSKYSRFLLPGTEGPPRGTVSSIRSGFFPPNDSLEESLQRLFEDYSNKTASPDDAYCLIAGKFALGHNESARSIAVNALKRFSDDPKINIIRAIIAYNYEEKKDTALVLLKKVLIENANDPVAGVAGFNLAVILSEQGEKGEALKILADLQAQFAQTLLGDRIEELLIEMESK